MNRHAVVVAFALASAPFIEASQARADCDGNENRSTRWSYPADGQTDVPFDAKIIGAPFDLAVTLDGEEVLPVEPGIWDPGPLEPGRTYHLETWLARYPDRAPSVEVATFTVGDSPAQIVTEQEVRALSVTAWQEAPPPPLDWESFSSRFYARDGCYDTCETAHAILKVNPDNAVAWWVSSPLDEVMNFGMAEGALAMSFCRPYQSEETCFGIRGIAADGAADVESLHCIDYYCDFSGAACEPSPGQRVSTEPPQPRAGGCGGTPSLAAPCVMLLWLGRRQRNQPWRPRKAK